MSILNKVFGKKKIECIPAYDDADIEITKSPAPMPSKPLKYNRCPKCNALFPGKHIVITKCNNCGYDARNVA